MVLPDCDRRNLVDHSFFLNSINSIMFVGLNLRISGSGRELQRLSPTAQSPSGGVVEWSGMEWSGMEWNGVEWGGVEWGGAGSSPN